MNLVTVDTFGVSVDFAKAAKPDWDCVAICDTAERVNTTVDAYQQITRGKNRIMVDREPRVGDRRQPPGGCGYCGREHWGECATDELGNVTPLTQEGAK